MCPIQREPLRSRIRDNLLQRILIGALPPGDKLGESALATELGVSRTPLREAFIRLEFEGMLESRPGRGFFVSPLDAKTARDIYSAVTKLERLTVRNSWNANGDELLLDELSRINAERRGALDDEVRLVDLDLEWHNVLISCTDNAQLRDLISLLRIRQYRYEYQFMKDRAHVRTAIEEHDRIAAALARQDVDDATQTLTEHWRRGLELALANFG